MAANGDSALMDSTFTVREPFPIFKLAHRYMLYDIDVVTHVRTQHHMLGVLVGTLPQANQQNVFLGLPLELQPEEARLLVEKGAAYIADDTADHKRDFLGQGGTSLNAEERRAYQAALRKQGQGAAQEAETARMQKKIAALDKKGLLTPAPAATENWNDMPDDMYTPGPRKRVVRKTSRLTSGALTPTGAEGSGFFGANGAAAAAAAQEGQNPDTSLFASPSPPPARDDDSHRAPAVAAAQALLGDGSDEPPPYGVTPTTSYLLNRAPRSIVSPSSSSELPAVSSSYPLFSSSA